MKTAVEDSEVTYALGFYPVDIKLDGSYHSLSVKVARKGMDLRYRKGYYATDLKSADRKTKRAIAPGDFRDAPGSHRHRDDRAAGS